LHCEEIWFLGEKVNKVLVVDDCEVSRLDLMAQFAELGMEIFELDSGNKVLEIVMQDRPSVIVLDVLMDGLDGFETLRSLEQVVNPPPVLVVSSNEQFLHIAKLHKVAGTFQKPVDFIQLKSKIHELGLI
jgi:CheY-like chemotaxis protein